MRNSFVRSLVPSMNGYTPQREQKEWFTILSPHRYTVSLAARVPARGHHQAPPVAEGAVARDPGCDRLAPEPEADVTAVTATLVGDEHDVIPKRWSSRGTAQRRWNRVGTFGVPGRARCPVSLRRAAQSTGGIRIASAVHLVQGAQELDLGREQLRRMTELAAPCRARGILPMRETIVPAEDARAEGRPRNGARAGFVGRWAGGGGCGGLGEPPLRLHAASARAAATRAAIGRRGSRIRRPVRRTACSQCPTPGPPAITGTNPLVRPVRFTQREPSSTDGDTPGPGEHREAARPPAPRPRQRGIRAQHAATRRHEASALFAVATAAARTAAAARGRGSRSPDRGPARPRPGAPPCPPCPPSPSSRPRCGASACPTR